MINFPTTTHTVSRKRIIVALATLAFALWIVPLMLNAATNQIEQIERIEAPAPRLSPAQAMRLLNPVPTPPITAFGGERLSPAQAMRMLNPVPTPPITAFGGAPKRLSPAQAMRLLNPVPTAP